MPMKKPDKKMLKELRQAIEADAPERVEPMLRAGVPVDQKIGDEHGTTLLGLAIEKNAVNVAKFLIRAGAKLDKGPNKPLVFAALFNRKEIAQALLQAGANPNATVSNPDEDVSGETALMDAIDSPEKIGLVESLLQRGADPRRANSKGESALFQAVDYGNLEAVRRLLAAGAKPSGVLLHPLIFRCTRESFEIMKLLIAAGTDLKAEGTRDSHFWGRTALEAAKGSYKAKVELIDEVSRRLREATEEDQDIKRWKAEAQIFQEMVDALNQAATAQTTR